MKNAHFPASFFVSWNGSLITKARFHFVLLRWSSVPWIPHYPVPFSDSEAILTGWPASWSRTPLIYSEAVSVPPLSFRFSFRYSFLRCILEKYLDKQFWREDSGNISKYHSSSMILITDILIKRIQNFCIFCICCNTTKQVDLKLSSFYFLDKKHSYISMLFHCLFLLAFLFMSNSSDQFF